MSPPFVLLVKVFSSLFFTSFIQLKKTQDSDLHGIALDEKNGFIYVTDRNFHVIWRMSMNGKDPIIFSGAKGDPEQHQI